MARIDYNGYVASAYEAGRGAPEGGLDGWREALADYVPTEKPLLDLGAGTGLYARLIHRWFGIGIVAVEPALAMLRQASVAPGIARVVGRAEQIPLAAGSCGGAWLSTMLHHVESLPAAARELRRVLAPHAPVLIRSTFPGDQARIALYTYFPTAGRVVDTFPSVTDVLTAFESAGFALAARSHIAQVNALTQAEFYEKVRRRANTTLLAIPDAEFEAGLDRLRVAVDTQPPGPVVSELQLLVLS